MTTTDHKTNVCTDNINTPVKVADRGDDPAPIKIFALEGNAELGTVSKPSDFIMLLSLYRITPDDVWSYCDAAMWAVWCDMAWRSLELAEYSDGNGRGDRGVA